MNAKWIAAAILIAAPAWGQEGQPERVTVPLTDPSRPAMVKVSLLNGSVAVRGYQGKEIIVESRSTSGHRHRDREEAPAGMRRIDVSGSGLNIEEQDNQVKISGGIASSADITIQVPMLTSLNLRTVNGRGVSVEGVSGEIDAQATNGSVTINNVSGTVVAHSLNGPLNVVLDKVAPDKPMSFSTLNGNIEVTFPPDLKANVRIKAENGDVWSDFDVTMKPSQGPQTERSEGRTRIKFDRGFYGTINGGGPEMQFTTMNGKIYLRKRK